MRVGVARLDGALRRVQILPPFEAVVLVAGAFRKERPEGLEVRGDPLFAQPRRQPGLEKAGRRVARPVQRAGIAGERRVLVGEMTAQIDEVEPRTGGELDRQVEGLIGHSAPSGTSGPN
jgi:hypothetical protein